VGEARWLGTRKVVWGGAAALGGGGTSWGGRRVPPPPEEHLRVGVGVGLSALTAAGVDPSWAVVS